MREKFVEQKLVMAVKAMGGIAPKFTSPGMAGMPDRLILLPDGKMGFVELKAPGKKPRPIQVARISQLRRLGFKVYVVDGVAQIGSVLDDIEEDA
ncbi:MAG: VRR-NUC domain-containing protein [Selenomonas sp.]|nr:VRR-NUC domain-containing protein [Selenomonas sp.]